MTSDRWLRGAAALALVGFLGCARNDRPEPPAIQRDVALVDDDVQFTHPYVPGHRTTMDGRVALRVQGGPPGTFELAHNLSFWLFVPERLEEPVMGGPPGAQILADPVPFDVPFPPAFDPTVRILGHHAVCDATEEFARPGERTNPYPCGPGTLNDCYDFTVVSTTSKTILGSQMWGTPVTVEVERPKTPAARIVRAELGEPVAGPFIPLNTEWTEPAVTQDGRLLTGRWGRAPRAWTNPETGETKVRFYDLAYAVLPEDRAPCDVTGWQDFHPISHAPFDPRMVGRYGLAAFPFRDAEGNPIEDGEDVGGTYPWVDREGTNVFMAGVPGRLVEQSEDVYPRRCVTPGCETYAENTDWDRGFLMAGLWTQGKWVHLDGLINNLDWAVGVTPAAHWWVTLYRDAAGADVEVRLGSGRFIDRVRNEGGPYPPGYTHNANILDSIMNLLTWSPATTPVLPRDVVWLMSTGVASDEIAFDDYSDVNAFIVSNMEASITPIYTDDGISTAMPHYWNGQVRRATLPIAVPSLFVLYPDAAEEIHVQNAATSLGWNVPSYGLVPPRAGRIEPVALGGIQGKGFWLDGANAITYAVPEQPRSIRETGWYVGLFLDPRSPEDEPRTVARFPDGSALRVAGHARAQYVRDGAVVREIALPATAARWIHLGLRLGDQNRDVTLLHDGFPVDRWQSPTPLFEFVPGDLVVGAAPDGAAPGFRGWIDDFKVFAHAVNPEVACNHAHGTLVRVEGDAGLGRAAAAYPPWAHDEIAAAAGEPAGSAQYACWHDYTADYAAHLGNIPAGATSVRGRINFPEGPVRAGVPRPDSTQNDFCLSCHHAEGKGGLSSRALEPRDVVAEHDRRRQPMQPPRRVFGNVPGGWIPPGPGPGSPPEAVQAPPEGLLIDPWVLPHGGEAARAAAGARAVHRH